MKTRWQFTPVARAETDRLARELGCSSALAAALVQRGCREPEQARRFLAPRLSSLTDPFEIPGITEAVGLISRALAEEKPITLYSDYDVDGLTSAALLSRLLASCGGRVNVFLPERMSEGYGLSLRGLERCLRECRPELLVVLDSGTNGAAEIDHLRSARVASIIVDHHEPESTARPDVLVNPKLSAGPTADHAGLCTAGLVFKLCHAFIKKNPDLSKGFDLKDHLDLVALGTVADLVPLTGENRTLVRHGLARMTRTRHAGLRSLMRVSGMTGVPNVTDCGFRLGPRLNAAGRLESARAALELLLSDDEASSLKIASQLDRMNLERREIQRRIHAEALERVGQGGDQRVIVVASEGWHEGVVGIVAAKLAQKFHRPSFVIALDGATGMGKGSGRSIPGFHLVDAINSVRDLLAAGGGHAMAAGVTIEAGRVAAFREALNRWAAASTDDSIWHRSLSVDLELPLSDVGAELMSELEQLEPFGQGNPPVVIAVRNATVGRRLRVGSEKKHLSLQLEQNGSRLRSIFFQYDERTDPEIGGRIDVAFELQKDEYYGNGQVQARLRDLALAGA